MSYEPLGQGLWYFLTSFVGTLGFAILLHAPKRAWLPASLIGAMTYTLYWSLKQLSLDEAASMFLAALFGSLLAQFCARKMRMIATIFLLLSVVALVPGLGLYRCMEQLGHQQYALGAQTGILFETMRHPEYIHHWLQILKGDSKAIFTAAAKAQHAADFVLDQAGIVPAKEETLPAAA